MNNPPGNPYEIFTPFLPTTVNFPEDPERIKVFLNDNFCNYADVINDKKIGAYTQGVENFNGEKWFYDSTKINRNGYQSIARITSFVPQTIPNPIPDINDQFVITLAYGSASLPTTATGAGDGDYFSFFGQGDLRIQFTLSDTEITITTDGAREDYSGFIIIHYLRNGV
jgi:hypothetical protein